MRDITIGQYYPVDSLVHSLDPRTKLMGTFLYIVALFLVKQPLWYLLFLLITLAEFRLAKVPFGYFMKGLRAVVILLLFTFFFRMVATPGDVLAEFWIFEITRQGITKGASLASRIALMITEASLLGYTTTPKELSDGLAKAFSPLKRIGLNIDEISIMVMIAFRFIPVMLEEANDLMDAQASRGVEFENCSVFTKTKNVFTLLMPLFVGSLERSGDLAMAMEARGYNGENPRSKMYPLEYGRYDRPAYIFSVLLLVFAVAARIAGIL
jgi:energy-coupling factor transport system permease protein